MNYQKPVRCLRPVITIVISFLCGYTCLSGQQTFTGSIMHDGIEREYLIYIPASYDGSEAVPLLLSFHGYTSTAPIHFAYSNFNNIADTAGFIAVFPQGSLLQGVPHWNVGGWTTQSTVDDVGFTDALIDTLLHNYNINEDRVYSAGMSNGGYMSFLLACQLGHRIAAIASVTGSMTPQTYNGCNPQHPTPVLQIHGTADGTVPYSGNPAWTQSIPDVIDYWTSYNQTETEAELVLIPDTNTSDGSTVEHYIYMQREACVSVEHFKVIGGNHDWPGAFGNMDINASAEIWKFVSSYDINGKIGCNTTSVIDHYSDLKQTQCYPNPATYQLRISHPYKKEISYRIFSITGEEILRGRLNSGEENIDLSSNPSGVYFLKTEKDVLRFIKH